MNPLIPHIMKLVQSVPLKKESEAKYFDLRLPGLATP
jgi:hypothetical protein